MFHSWSLLLKKLCGSRIVWTRAVLFTLKSSSGHWAVKLPVTSSCPSETLISIRLWMWESEECWWVSDAPLAGGNLSPSPRKPWSSSAVNSGISVSNCFSFWVLALAFKSLVNFLQFSISCLKVQSHTKAECCFVFPSRSLFSFRSDPFRSSETAKTIHTGNVVLTLAPPLLRL